MGICADHWGKLREAIDKRGLGTLVSESGEEAVRKLADELESGESTVDSFDPLMTAYFAIQNNSMTTLESVGGNPMYILIDGPEDIVEGYGPEFAIRTWPRCPICYLGLIHEMTCSGLPCELPKKDGFAWMIDRAADDALEQWKSMSSN